MSAKALVLLLALVILGIAIFNRYNNSSTLHVDPHAAQEIEKAKRR